MFADDKSIENFQQLFFEFKKYLELQKEYTKLELTEKLTILLSTLIMVLVLIILGMVAVLFFIRLGIYFRTTGRRSHGKLRHYCGHQHLTNCHCHYFPQETHHLPDGKLPCRSVS